MTGWDLLVGRDDLTRTSLVDVDTPAAAAGQAVLRVDRVGMTANNVTYAVFGDAMKYWDFFPATDGWGRVPLWGFADVVDSQVEGVEVGQRLFGYYPTSSHLVVEPGRVDVAGFRDMSPHRAALPSPYNGYQRVEADPAYEAHREDLQALYRPLFFTSFMLADFLQDKDFFGARSVVLSSASSKTAYGTAFLLEGVHRVGLTSAGNVAFTRSLGCYDDVLSYDDVTTLPADVPTAYVDMSGSAPLRVAVHEHLQESLVHDAVVGATHYEEQGDAGRLPGARPAFFFAPDQMLKRRADWGSDGITARFGEAWRRFAPTAEGWVDVVEGQGREALRDVWLEVLAGRSAPRAGNVVRL